jgi:hypothetical protein
VAVVTTTATGPSTTVATAVAAAEAAEEEDTAAGFNPAPVPDTNLLCLIYTPSLHYWFTVVTHFFFEFFFCSNSNTNLSMCSRKHG